MAHLNTGYDVSVICYYMGIGTFLRMRSPRSEMLKPLLRDKNKTCVTMTGGIYTVRKDQER